MNRKPLAPLLILATSIAAFAAPTGEEQLQVYPKNVARHHCGANLFYFNSSNPAVQKYEGTQAAAAWLDDDNTTGFAPLSGKQYYMLALPEPEVVTNFAISTKSASGTISLYGSDEAAAPGAKVWVPLAKEVPVEAVNEKKLSSPLSRLCKYVLIETDMADPAPIYSLFVYANAPATGFAVVQREQPLDEKGIFGTYVNDATVLNWASLGAGGRVEYVNDAGSKTGWQKMIDDNPASGVQIAPGGVGAVVSLMVPQKVNRVSVVAQSPKGKLEVFALPNYEKPAVVASAPAAASGVSIDGLTAIATLEFDGSSTRLSQDFAAVDAGALAFRWTPTEGTGSIEVREASAFGEFSLADAGLQKLAAIAEGPEEGQSGGGEGKGGKGLEPVKELLPIGESLARSAPYLSPALGFPPPIFNRRIVRIPPDESP